VLRGASGTVEHAPWPTERVCGGPAKQSRGAGERGARGAPAGARSTRPLPVPRRGAPGEKCCSTVRAGNDPIIPGPSAEARTGVSQFCPGTRRIATSGTAKERSPGTSKISPFTASAIDPGHDMAHLTWTAGGSAGFHGRGRPAWLSLGSPPVVRARPPRMGTGSTRCGRRAVTADWQRRIDDRWRRANRLGRAECLGWTPASGPLPTRHGPPKRRSRQTLSWGGLMT